MPDLTIRGAYGRDYLTAQDALADWDAGKDFKIFGGPYLSSRDVNSLRSQHIRTLYFESRNNGLLFTMALAPQHVVMPQVLVDAHAPLKSVRIVRNENDHDNIVQYDVVIRDHAEGSLVVLHATTLETADQLCNLAAQCSAVRLDTITVKD